jgi:hypothetical protein
VAIWVDEMEERMEAEDEAVSRRSGATPGADGGVPFPRLVPAGTARWSAHLRASGRWSLASLGTLSRHHVSCVTVLLRSRERCAIGSEHLLRSPMLWGMMSAP